MEMVSQLLSHLLDFFSCCHSQMVNVSMCRRINRNKYGQDLSRFGQDLARDLVEIYYLVRILI